MTTIQTNAWPSQRPGRAKTAFATDRLREPPTIDTQERMPVQSAPTEMTTVDWLRRLRELVERRSRTASECQQHRDEQTREEQDAYRTARRQLESSLQQERDRLAAEFQAHHAGAEAHWAQQLTDLKNATRAALRDVDERLEEEQAAAQNSRDETTWLVGSLLDEQATDSPLQQMQRLHAQIDGAETVLHEAVRKAEQQRTQSAEYLERCRLSTEVGLFEPAPPPTTLAGLQERCLEEVELVEAPYKQLRKMWLPRCFRGLTPGLVWLGITLVLALPAWLLLDPTELRLSIPNDDFIWPLILAACGGALALVTLLMLHLTANQRAFPLVTEIFAHSRAAQALFARWQRLAAEELATTHQELDRKHGRRKQHRDEALTKADAEFKERMTELTEWRRSEVSRLQTFDRTRREQLEQARDAQLAQMQAHTSHTLAEFDQQRHDQLSFIETHHAARMEEIRQEFDTAWQQLVEQWQTGISELGTQAAEWNRTAAVDAPDWRTLVPAVVSEMPAAVGLGHYQVDLKSLPNGVPTEPDLQPPDSSWQLPCAVDIARRPAVLWQYDDASGRQASAVALQAMMLKLLATLPSGQVRFTILDPLSLGDQFATFMHLADFDELLISTRIWTEPMQIEEQLADLTEHMETVLQMFLRNEFATLEEYNRVAGEVAEPYRVLVVSGLPTGFSDMAMRRLWSIVTSGARCGLIPLIAVDTQLPLPRGYQLSDLQPHVTTLRWRQQSWRWDEPELREWPLIIDPPPEPARFGELVKQFGQLAGDVRRVEVPFQRVAPADDALWRNSAAQRLEIPIGRSGATRTQSLMLGTGTSQHVLIAGKTGSGKSTLLHAVITNAALHYSPEELELYLIDFKKGVEFKVYARQQLPHARVVGIESDREFGVSVLERLDRELQDRSALFRDAGVSDLAGFRKACPERPLPRVLLIIDEFQEFFVDDDALSQQAALLLDRLIRQGRAFGVHAILGSQTLAGAYSLARSTLGQVAVRIALQCSESDAHLILSEENTAARLLTRPGEAIYNDANGLTSGNHLFQVVWLDDDDRDRYLALITARSHDDGRTPTPMTVFEGNIPADLANLPPAKTQSRSQAVTAWLGEAVSLRGALGLEFAPASGSHLLIVGQDEPSALGMLVGAALSVTAADLPDSRLFIFNGSPQESAHEAWQELEAAAPALSLHDQADLESILKELADEVRLRDGRPGPRRWLCLFDLVRFRKLRRKDDDFGFGGFDKKEASPSDLLAEILRDGPSVGVHVWLWCDSTNTVSRWLSREMQQQLENRVALAMNANDSSQLIDSPAASRLGANRAWLYRGDRGTLDKFRPYSAPRAGQIAALRQRLSTASPEQRASE